MLHRYLKCLNSVNHTLNGKSALQRFERSNMVEIHNRIMFNSTQHCHHKIYIFSCVNNETREKVWGTRLHRCAYSKKREVLNTHQNK